MTKLKADQPPPLGYLPMPPDYRHTDKCLGLIMTTIYSKFEDDYVLLHSEAEPDL